MVHAGMEVPALRQGPADLHVHGFDLKQEGPRSPKQRPWVIRVNVQVRDLPGAREGTSYSRVAPGSHEPGECPGVLVHRTP
jgi:hypothetical protein